MKLSILKKTIVNPPINMGSDAKPDEKPYTPPPGTNRNDWFKWYSETYLTSRHWIEKREEILIRDERRCRGCGCSSTRTNALQVHHRDYENLYHETNATLVTLCTRCHKAIHRSKK